MFILVFLSSRLTAQVGGVSSGFNFMRLPMQPQLTALGGANVSQQSADIGMTIQNPALLRKEMHGQLALSFGSIFQGLKNLGLVYGRHIPERKIQTALAINYLNYGQTDQTDIAGTINGQFRAIDYTIQAQFSTQYEEHWYYGASVKFIASNLGWFRSSALAIDLGVNYFDSAAGFQAGLTLKNIGYRLKTFAGDERSDLPFDIQIGASKKLRNIPLQFSVTAYGLQDFPFLKTNNQDENYSLANKIILHLIISGQLQIAQRLELSLAYNHLRRTELLTAGYPEGLTGWSLGMGVLFQRMKFRYATSFYQNNQSWHQFGLSLSVHDFF